MIFQHFTRWTCKKWLTSSNKTLGSDAKIIRSELSSPDKWCWMMFACWWKTENFFLLFTKKKKWTQNCFVFRHISGWIFVTSDFYILLALFSCTTYTRDQVRLLNFKHVDPKRNGNKFSRWNMRAQVVENVLILRGASSDLVKFVVMRPTRNVFGVWKVFHNFAMIH